MDVLIPALVLAALVLVLVVPPLRAGSQSETESAARADLEAAKEAKYREIRDAELDHRMGKLSEADWKALDTELRAQAIAILKQLDDLDASNGQPATGND